MKTGGSSWRQTRDTSALQSVVSATEESEGPQLSGYTVSGIGFSHYFFPGMVCTVFILIGIEIILCHWKQERFD